VVREQLVRDQSNRGGGIMRSTLSVCAVALISACATMSNQPDTLEQIQSRQVRDLTAGCYWQNEGLRFLYGDPAIAAACRRWADARVRPRTRAGG
jgi:hypothetical protein